MAKPKLLLTKDQILGAADRKHEDVDCPEWGGTVRVASMSGADRDEFEVESYTSAEKDKGKRMLNFRARLCARCIVDENFVRLFDMESIEELAKKDSAPLDRCYDVAQKLNGMRPQDVEDLTKN